MKGRKYALTKTTMEFEGVTLFQIKAVRSFGNVKVGDLGGYVSGKHVLSHIGDCWVYENGIAVGGKITDNASIYGTSIRSVISGETKLGANAIVNNCDIKILSFDNCEISNITLIEDIAETIINYDNFCQVKFSLIDFEIQFIAVLNHNGDIFIFNGNNKYAIDDYLLQFEYIHRLRINSLISSMVQFLR